MLGKNEDLHMPEEVIDYLNTYPAFKETRGERINDMFFNDYISNVMLTVVVNREKGRAFAEDSSDQPLADYCSAIWGLEGYTMTMEDAEDLLRWMEPKWCAFRGIESSGFFHDDSVTLTEDEDFVV